MSYNASWDAQEIDLNLPYNTLEKELSDLPRIISGQNTLVTLGNKLVRRPGTVAAFANNTFTGRVERSIIYETMDNPTPKVYLVMSVLNNSTGLYEIWHTELVANPATPVKSGTYRDMDKSQYPHEMIVARGLLYIKAFPNTTEKLGSVIFDGTGGTVVIKPWGALGPSSPADMNVALGVITTAINATATSLSVTGGVWSAPTWVAFVEHEQMLVTAQTGTSGAQTLTVTRGINGTTAVSHSAYTPIMLAAFNANSYPYTINQYWTYSYAYISITGQITDRAAVQTNPPTPPNYQSPHPSRTPPLNTNNALAPRINIQGLADTTNFPSIAIFRTSDGGGTFYQIDTITNTGAGNIVYNDISVPGGATAGPVPDSQLSTFATTLTSNTPPPPVASPKVIGVDTPVRSSPMAYFQGRIWYAIGNVLFFSAQEEVLAGVPEECWPSGVNGNFFRLQYPVTNLQATEEGLFVFTTKVIYKFTGSTLDTFSYQPLFSNYGHPVGHPRAITHWGNTIAFLNTDYRILLIENDLIVNISQPIPTDFINAINNGGEIELQYFSYEEKDWLVVSSHVLANPTNSRQWVYDIRKSIAITSDVSPPLGGAYTPKTFFWNTPWTYPSTSVRPGRLNETDYFNRLLIFNWNSSNNTTYIAKFNFDSTTLVTDQIQSGTSLPQCKFTTNLFRVPAGNHVNAKRVPDITPVIYSLRLDRTLFTGDTDPQVYLYFDDIWTQPIPANVAEDPPRRPLSIGYKTLEYPIFQAAQRFGFTIDKGQFNADAFALQNAIVVFEPDAGA